MCTLQPSTIHRISHTYRLGITSITCAAILSASSPQVIQASEFSIATASIAGYESEGPNAAGIEINQSSARAAAKAAGIVRSGLGFIVSTDFYRASGRVLNFSGFDTGVSINDSGTVAFIGKINKDANEAHQNLFSFETSNNTLRVLGNRLFELRETGDSPRQVYGPGVQINNAGRVLSRRVLTAKVFTPPTLPIGTIADAPLSYLETWSASQSSQQRCQQIFMGNGGVSPSLYLVLNPLWAGWSTWNNDWASHLINLPSPIDRATELAGIFGRATFNNKGGSFFGALNGAGDNLATVTPGGNWLVRLTSERPAPQMADDGNTVFRLGSADSGRIVVVPPQFFPFTASITQPGQFKSIGYMPGISDNGLGVAFTGDGGRKELLYVSLKGAAGFESPIAILGNTPNGYYEPGETGDLNANGLVEDGELEMGGIRRFEIASRVGVQTERQGDIYRVRVAVVGYDERDRKSLYTVEALIGPSRVPDVMVNQALAAGDSIPGLPGIVTDIALHDPINASGVIAAWIRTSFGEAIITSGTASLGVAQDGGVRERLDGAEISTPDGSITVWVFDDRNGDGTPSDGEPKALAEDARIQEGDNNRFLYFTTPAVPTGVEFDLEGRANLSIQVRTSGGIKTYANALVYFNNPVDCLRAVRAGLMTAFDEAFVGPDTGNRRLLSYSISAGARAENVVRSLLRRAKPASVPGHEEERSALALQVERMPWDLADYLQARLGTSATGLRAVVLGPTWGQTLHGIHIDDPSLQAVFALGSGTLALTQANEALTPSANRITDGRLILPQDPPETSFDYSDTGKGWKVQLVREEMTGLTVRNAFVLRGTREEMVATSLSFPTIAGFGRGRLPLQDSIHLSHIFITPNAHQVFPEEDGLVLSEWVASGAYRIPLGETTARSNAADPAVSVRQVFAFSAPYDAYEPAHCMRTVQMFPQVVWHTSIPVESPVTAPSSLRLEHRFGLRPQQNMYTNDRYLAGLFTDVDEPEWWVESSVPGAPIDCLPLPFWWNMFEPGGKTVSVVPRESVFDTRFDDFTFPSPDNVHLHHQRLPSDRVPFLQDSLFDLPLVDISYAWASILPEPFTGDWAESRNIEAPGSVDGVIHFHWRWGTSYKQFGQGSKLTGKDQDWTMALARGDFPMIYDYIQDHLADAPIEFGPKNLLVSSEQRLVGKNRIYTSLRTGIGYGLGANDACWLITPINNYLTYGFIKKGFEPDEPYAQTWRASHLLLTLGISEFVNVATYLPFGNSAPGLRYLFGGPVNIHHGHGCGRGHHMRDNTPWRGIAGRAAGRASGPAFIGFRRSGLVPAWPMVVTNELGNFRLSSPGSTNAWRLCVDEAGVPGGLRLLQPPTDKGRTMRIELPSSCHEVLGLSVYLRSRTNGLGISVRLLQEGRLLQESFWPANAQTPHGFREAILNLRSTEGFDAIELSVPHPAVEMAVSQFAVVPDLYDEADANRDGRLDADDFVGLALVYGTGVETLLPWAHGFDINRDGKVGAQDYARMASASPGAAATNALHLRGLTGLPREVLSGQSLTLDADPVDLTGGEATVRWQVTSGVVASSIARRTLWQSPVVTNAAGVDILVTAIPSRGALDGAAVSQTVRVLPYWVTNWSRVYFPRIAGEVDGAADADHDGLSNALEYLLATDPTVPNRTLEELVVADADPDGPALSMRVRSDAVDFSLTIETSTNLIDWQPALLTSHPVADLAAVPAQLVTARAPVAVRGPGVGFFRIICRRQAR